MYHPFAIHSQGARLSKTVPLERAMMEKRGSHPRRHLARGISTSHLPENVEQHNLGLDPNFQTRHSDFVRHYYWLPPWFLLHRLLICLNSAGGLLKISSCLCSYMIASGSAANSRSGVDEIPDFRSQPPSPATSPRPAPKTSAASHIGRGITIMTESKKLPNTGNHFHSSSE